MRPVDHHIRSTVSESLKVRIDWIGEDGFDFDEPLQAAWLDRTLGSDSPYRADGDGRLTLHLMRAEQVVHVRGRVLVSLKAECVRCLGPAPLALDLPIEVALFPRGEEPEAAIDGEVANEDLGVSSYDEEEIDFASLVHDEVFLELPMNPVCTEKCAGLCPQCGTNLNEGRCSCVSEIDPRWQGLRGIKVD